MSNQQRWQAWVMHRTFKDLSTLLPMDLQRHSTKELDEKFPRENEPSAEAMHEN
jgi:hypothetical protein